MSKDGSVEDNDYYADDYRVLELQNYHTVMQTLKLNTVYTTFLLFCENSRYSIINRGIKNKIRFSQVKKQDNHCESGRIYGKIICYEDTNFIL